MKIGTELLYHLLNEVLPVSRFGHGLKADELALPVFYKYGTSLVPGKVYIARTQDLPQISHTECLFICVGNAPTHVWNSWRGEVFWVNDRSLDLLSLFNTVIEFFDRITSWSMKMQSLLDTHADIEELVRASIPVFGNCITITDYDLRVLVNSNVDTINGRREIRLSRQFDYIPNEVSVSFQQTYIRNIRQREPFMYKGHHEGNPDGNNYCINLFLGDNYIGTCTLADKLRPLQESDFILFQQFAFYIRRVLCSQSRTSPKQLVTIKTILSDLLQCFPVSSENLNWALNLLHRNMEFQGIRFGCWHCFTIQSANQGKSLPEEYLCTSLENMLPHCTAIAFNDRMVCYCMIPEGENYKDTICPILEPYLQDMNFRAGVSAPFQDVFKAYDYYLQSSAMLTIGRIHAPQQYLYHFEDHILPYMLQHCLGEFELDMILSEGILKLRNLESSVDYWDTLRRYLDNECNASKTAQELYLHRSSLLPRLEKIKTLVDIDTPQQRLYLRLCMELCDLMDIQKQKKNSDQ